MIASRYTRPTLHILAIRYYLGLQEVVFLFEIQRKLRLSNPEDTLAFALRPMGDRTALRG